MNELLFIFSVFILIYNLEMLSDFVIFIIELFKFFYEALITFLVLVSQINIYFKMSRFLLGFCLSSSNIIIYYLFYLVVFQLPTIFVFCFFC